MATHLYCLLTPPRPEARPASLTGVSQLPVRSLVAGDIEAWVSDAPARVASDSVDARNLLVSQALEHNTVLDAALATSRTPIPARFGQRFVDDEALLRDVRQQTTHLRDLLARVAGAVEMGVIVAPSLRRTLGDLEPVSPQIIDATARGAGLQYLEHVRERLASGSRSREKLEFVAGCVSKAVAGLVRAERRVENAARGTATMSVAHLVDRERVDAYRQAVAAIAPNADWRLLVAGPRAPYSFGVAEGGEAA